MTTAAKSRSGRRWWRFAVLALGFGAPVRGVAAQDRPAASILGMVRDSAGLVIADVELSVLGAGVRTRSAADGSYRLNGLQAGRAIVIARRLGYVAQQLPLRLADGEQRQLNFVLAVRAQRLEAESVVAKPEPYDARLAGFNERRQKQVGHFVTRERIERANSATLVDVLREIPGMRISSVSMGARVVRIRSSTCPPLVFIDGVPATAGEFDLDMIDVKTVEGIEVYGGLGSTPPEFSGPRDLDRCGVIAIWSRPARARKREVVDRPVTGSAAGAGTEAFGGDEVDVPARADSNALRPVYPDSLYRARATGRVVAEFVVDTAGRVEAESIDLLGGSDARFAETVRAALLAAHFQPATRGGRRVRQVMQAPFVFAIEPVPVTLPAPDENKV